MPHLLSEIYEIENGPNSVTNINKAAIPAIKQATVVNSSPINEQQANCFITQSFPIGEFFFHKNFISYFFILLYLLFFLSIVTSNSHQEQMQATGLSENQNNKFQIYNTSANNQLIDHNIAINNQQQHSIQAIQAKTNNEKVVTSFFQDSKCSLRRCQIL